VVVANRRLRIAIDARELAGRPTGVGRYVAGVLETWAQQAFPHALTLILHAPPPDWLRTLPLDLTLDLHPADVAGTWWEQTVLPGAVVAARADVLLAPAYTAPLAPPCPTVLIVHDVSFFAQPQGFRWREGLRRRLLTRAAAHQAAAVLTDSAFSAAEIVRYLGVPASQVTVAAQGAPAWVGGPEAAARDPHVLSVGTLFTRRHVPALLEAFAQVAGRLPDARLTLVGQNQTHPHIDPIAIADRLGIGTRVAWHPWVTDAELDALYRSARAFAFLSDYEGFGMTPMEAAARGVPSVLLDTPVFREVYGDAARLVPLDSGTIAESLITLLTQEDVHADLVTKARGRLTHFPWTTTARLVQQALEEAAR
jgi:glycosyltransferase involved in cell wall biosynthesis